MSKKKILLLCSFIAIIGFIFLSVHVKAHDPSMVELWYEVGPDDGVTITPKTDERLTVIITHDVTDEHVHFVERVEVFVNGYVIYNLTYTFQPHYSMWELTFDDLSTLYNASSGEFIDGDEIIGIRATCNIDGSFYNEIDLAHPYHHHETDFKTAIVPSVVIAIALSAPLVGILMIDNIKKKKR
jgi:hypothetical protein